MWLCIICLLGSFGSVCVCATVCASVGGVFFVCVCVYACILFNEYLTGLMSGSWISLGFIWNYYQRRSRLCELYRCLLWCYWSTPCSVASNIGSNGDIACYHLWIYKWLSNPSLEWQTFKALELGCPRFMKQHCCLQTLSSESNAVRVTLLGRLVDSLSLELCILFFPTVPVLWEKKELLCPPFRSWGMIPINQSADLP